MSTPEPGIYEDIPFDVYASWDAMNNSLLKAAIRPDGAISMAHMREAMTTPKKPSTTSMRFGSLVHTCALEPQEILARYVVIPESLTEGCLTKAGKVSANPKGTADYRERLATFAAANPDRDLVEPAEHARMQGTLYSLAQNPLAARLLREEGPTELSLVWLDEATGVPLKRRIDKLGCELKTTADLSMFPKQILRYGYHMAAALEVDGWAALTGNVYEPRWVVVESASPFCTQVAPVGCATLNLGRKTYRDILERYCQAKNTDIWPGPDNPLEFDVPAWATNDPLIS